MEVIIHIFETLNKKPEITFLVWILMSATSLVFIMIFDFLKNNGNIISDFDGDDMICIILLMTLGLVGGIFIIIIYMKEYKEYRERVKKDSRWWELREYGGWK